MGDKVTLDVKEEVNSMGICYGCLSNGRRLSVLSENSDIFLFLLGRDDVFDTTHISLCWECSSTLRNMRRFQQKILKAQDIIRQGFQFGDNICLSSLTVVNPESMGQHCKLRSVTKTAVENNKHDNIIIGNLTVKLHKEDLNILKEEIKVKHENEIDSANEIDTDFLDLSFDAEKQIEIKKISKGWKQHRPYKKMGKFIENKNIDFENFDNYFADFVLCEAEMASPSLGKKVKNGRYSKNSVMTCCRCSLKFGSSLHCNMHKTFCHLLKDGKQGPFKCLTCRQRCPDQDSLREHWQKHSEASKCNICEVVLERGSNKAKKQHLEMHRYSIVCKYCDGLTCSSRRDLRQHYISLHLWSCCDYCGKKFKKKETLRRHIGRNHMPFICKKCHKTFDTHTGLSRHIKSVHDQIVLTKPELAFCVECDKQFLTIEKYKKHLNTCKTHNPAYRRYKIVHCPECGQQFRRTVYMKNHFNQKHRGKTQYYCAICDKYLSSAWSLKIHNKGVHMKIRNPKNKICDLCGRGFSSNTILEKHIRTHTGERPYRCPHCPAAFTQKHPLTTHMRTQHKILDPYNVLPVRYKDYIGESTISD